MRLKTVWGRAFTLVIFEFGSIEMAWVINNLHTLNVFRVRNKSITGEI